MAVLREVVPNPSRRYTVLPLKRLLAYKDEHANFVTLCTTNAIHLIEPVDSYMRVNFPTSDQWACMLLGVCLTTRVQSVLSKLEYYYGSATGSGTDS